MSAPSHCFIISESSSDKSTVSLAQTLSRVPILVKDFEKYYASFHIYTTECSPPLLSSSCLAFNFSFVAF